MVDYIPPTKNKLSGKKSSAPAGESSSGVFRENTKDKKMYGENGRKTDNLSSDEGIVCDRRTSISSGVDDGDDVPITSANEELMDNILRDFDKSKADVQTDNGISSSEKLLRYVEHNTIGSGVCFHGPFGERTATYCDYTASGRPLRFIEDYINEHVLPLYSNTHTTTNFLSRQTTKFREEAREIIKTSVNANKEDALIYTGSGTTGAIHKLIGVLELNERRSKKTIVFVGPYEHHSNILPWKEACATVHRIRETIHGNIDTRHLRNLLKKYSNSSHLLIGCFSAASNVTGITTDTSSITSILHEYGALSFWDYATGAPYLDIDMNPISNEEGVNLSKDAIFFSPHKFIGGPGTPGVLVAKRRLFRNAVPTTCGGGTVTYVTRNIHVYLKNPEEREEGGTPAIVESIRAGLVFQLKDAIGTEFIWKKEKEFTERAFEKFMKIPEIEILGSTTANRLPIFSFLIRNPKTNKLLHHNFVSVLLNDLYGVQVRSGCACAGPYGQDLMGIDEELAMKFAVFLIEDKSQQKLGLRHNSSSKTEQLEIMKPGFTRLNLPYFASYEVVEFILDAVVDVAKNGWKLLPQYSCDAKSGAWIHQPGGKISSGKDAPDSLHGNDYYNGKFNSPKCPYTTRHEHGKVRSQRFKQYLSSARKVYKEAVSKSQGILRNDHKTIESMGVESKMVWFMQPHEAHNLLTGQGQSTDQEQSTENVIQKQNPTFKPKIFADKNWKPPVSKKKTRATPSNAAKSSVCNIL